MDTSVVEYDTSSCSHVCSFEDTATRKFTEQKQAAIGGGTNTCSHLYPDMAVPCNQTSQCKKFEKEGGALDGLKMRLTNIWGKDKLFDVCEHMYPNGSGKSSDTGAYPRSYNNWNLMKQNNLFCGNTFDSDWSDVMTCNNKSVIAPSGVQFDWYKNPNCGGQKVPVLSNVRNWDNNDRYCAAKVQPKTGFYCEKGLGGSDVANVGFANGDLSDGRFGRNPRGVLCEQDKLLTREECDKVSVNINASRHSNYWGDNKGWQPGCSYIPGSGLVFNANKEKGNNTEYQAISNAFCKMD